MTTAKPELSAEKCAEYGVAAYARQAPQDVAQYQPLGGTGMQACANCLFFVSPNGCTVVEGWPIAISPTGLSRFWTAVPAQTPMELMPVIIVAEEVEIEGGGDDEDKSKASPGLLSRIVSAVKGVFEEAPTPMEPEPTGFYLTKDRSGDLRWVAWVSNQFRDHDNPPEIIESKAHREFVDYLDKGGQMPEAWLWHTPGTRWGRADWADYADGFLLMSGTVDKGREPVAERLMKSGGGLGVSHGFKFEYADEKAGHIGWYRTFEISPLPREAAANRWTGLEVMKKEAGMPGFSDTKRAWLSDKLGADEVARLEKDTGALSKALLDAGIDLKEMPQDVPATASVKEITDALAPQFKTISDSLEGFKATTEQAMASLDERLKAVERSDDEKVAETILKARIGAGGGGYRASQSDGTVLKEGDALEQARPVIDPGFAASLKQ